MGINRFKEAIVSNQTRQSGGTDGRRTPSHSPDDIRPVAVEGQEVVFLGWQKTTSGDLHPLYNILKAGHPLYLSTVTDTTLHANHLRIPRTPSPYPGVGPSPWQEIGTELLYPATAREAIDFAGLDYTVVKKPLKEVVDLTQPGNVPDRWATVRTDTGAVLGIVDDSYEPIQNRDAFKFFDSLVGTDEAIYETAGSLGRGERVWILAKLPGYIKVNRKDIVGKYLLLSNSHDGSSLVRVKLTPIRVVCNNTLTAALRGAGDIHIGHTVNTAEDLKQASSLLGLTNSLYEQLDGIFNRMALTKISDKQLQDYVKALVPDDIEGEVPKKNQEIRDAFLTLHESGQGSDLSRGTLWGALNCVTEYTDHGKDGNPNSRLESIWFGRGEELKQKAFQLAERMI
jgi:phage/plasmid-like protein (TIGR03299 family)